MVTHALVAHCLELLAPLGSVRARRMFGGHGIYIDEIFCALVANERLYFKTCPATQPQFVAAGCEAFVYDTQGKAVALNYWSVPAEALESPELMAPWARLALQAAIAARAAKPPAARQRQIRR